MPSDRGGNRRLISRKARDERRPCHVVAIELGHPPIRKILRGARIRPPEAVRYFRGAAGGRQAGNPFGQQLEEAGREEVTVRIAETHGAIIIGLVSDTHGLVRPGVFEALRGVSQILHAGDVGGRGVLDELGAIAPVTAVYGNTDPAGPPLEARHTLCAGGLEIHMTHGHELGSPTPERLLALYSGDVLVYGHTHRALVQRAGTRLVVNPGAAGPRRFDVVPSVARLTITRGRADVEIIELG